MKSALYFRLCAAAISLLALTLSPKAQKRPSASTSNYSPILTEQLNPKLKTPITLWAKDASLSEVLKVLAEKSEMNFVAGEGVNREKITIILNKTPLDESINLLVRASGLSYEIIGNSVLIAEQEKLKEEVGLSGYVVELKYVGAIEAASMLADLTKNIKIDEGGNRLVCYTSPRVINEIEKIIKSIDHPHILIVLETRIIEVKLDNLDKYGIDWGTLLPIESGVRYEESPLKEDFNLDNWTQLSANFRLLLDMMLSNGDARILMNSKLTTTNNREANLHIGEIIPYEVQTFNMSVAGGANRTIQKEEVGLKVMMTPHVNEDGQITLMLEPEVSSIAGWKGADSNIPLVRVRKTKTTVRVEDEQTLFLAGLISEENTEEIRKVPVLGDIPLLGLLFQHHSKTVSKSNLIIEITPKIIYNPRDLSFETDIGTIRDKSDMMYKETADSVSQ